MTKRAILGVVILSAGLAGCETGPQCEGDWCGTVVVSTAGDIDATFPPAVQGVLSFAVLDLVYLRLADLADDLNTVGDEGFVPQLASSWERLDDLTLRFHMDRRATWSDGVPVTAGDVAFTFDVYTDTLVASRFAGEVSRISGVTAVDDSTVDFRFTSHFPEQLYEASYHMRILPSHIMDSIPRDRLAEHPSNRSPVGNGPYVLTRWLPDQMIELRSDSSFFLGRPGLRRILWQVASDRETQLQRLIGDEVDVVPALRGSDEIGRVATSPQVRLINYPSNSYQYLQFNVRDPEDSSRPHPLFADRTLRRALSMAVDRATVRRSVYGDHGTESVAPVSQVLSIWRPDLPRIDYDTARAAEMLGGLGWVDSDGDGVRDRNGQPLEFELLVVASDPNRRAAAVIIQEQFRRVGVQMNIAELEVGSLVERVPAGRFDLFFGFRGQDPTPSTIRNAWGSVGIGGGNFGGYSNPRVDELMDRAIDEFDPEVARDLWQQALTEMVSDAPAIWLYSPASVMAIHRRVENVTIRPDQWAAKMWTWGVPADRTIARDVAGI